MTTPPTAAWRHVRAWDAPSMGGRLAIDVTLLEGDGTSAEDAAGRLAARVARRVDAWAARLTRFQPASDLSHLNASDAAATPVRPTLAAILHWSARAADLSGGIVDVTMLRERLAAEAGGRTPSEEPRDWQLSGPVRRAVAIRSGRVAFDLDGVAKGWLADRALALMTRAHGAIVDADGDIAIRLAPGDSIRIGIADPRRPAPDRVLADLHLVERGRAGGWFGVATSGTSVHRWTHRGAAGHHLIDPRTRRPAITDLAQATVLARSARHAEVLAKTAVILGFHEGVRFLERAEVLAAVLLTDRGETLAIPRSLRWLEAA